jgi:hypothetical protein
LPTLPNASETHIRVSPRQATIVVGQSQALSAATLDSTGDSTGVATVTWVSSAQSVASVSSAGVASGLAAGVTTVVAKTSSGAIDSAVITVVATKCDGITPSSQVHGRLTLTYHYAATLGTVAYLANDTASVMFAADSSTSANGYGLWFAAATGNGSLRETRTDLQTAAAQTITGVGALVVSGINLSHVLVKVNLSTCEYTIEAVPYVDATESPDPGDLGPSWIGWLRTPSIPIDTATHTTSLAVHSAAWATAHYNTTADGWYWPLGFSADYFSDGAPDDGSVGDATVTYSLARGP